MPSLNFVLPHWLYWGILIVFPLIAMYLVKRQKERGVPQGPSLFVAYLFWLCSGFMGLHRLYLRSLWGFIFIPVFLVILYANGEIRDRREDVSRTRAAVESSHTAIRRAQIPPNATATPDMLEALKKAQSEGKVAEQQFAEAEGDLDRWHSYSRWLAILMAAMLVADALLLPREVRRAAEREAAERRLHPPRRKSSPTFRSRAPRKIPRWACTPGSPTRLNG